MGQRLGVMMTGLAAIPVLAPFVAVAQVSGSYRTIYTAADYTAFSPQTALDISRCRA